MRQNELMVGDWVKLDFYDTPYGDEEDAVWKNGKITAIHHKNWVDINFGGPLDECDIEVEDVRPIPLTPEILEKNGMRVFEHRNPWQGDNLIKKWYHKSGSYYVSLYKVGQNQTFTIGGVYYPSRICNVRYVHELQHALRLCGIEKQIEL